MRAFWGRLVAASRRGARARYAWTRLAPPDRSAYLRAWWALLAGRLQVGPRSRPHPAATASNLTADPHSRSVEVRRLLAVFRLAGRTHPCNLTCLPRSLALQRFLAQHGVATELRLGMRRGPQGLEGHAWVEHQGGVPFDDTKRLQSYVPLEWTR
jgi:hypothetical protein